MIGRLRGIWDGGIIDVSGVGYVVHVPRPPADGTETTLHIHTHDTGNGTTLYGFTRADELQLFRAVIATPGVGPAAARSILESMGAAEAARSIRSGDIPGIAACRGVGRKTAERIIRMCDVSALPDSAGDMPDAVRDATEGLVTLGWDGKEASRAAQEASRAGHGTVEDIVRHALGSTKRT